MSYFFFFVHTMNISGVQWGFGPYRLSLFKIYLYFIFREVLERSLQVICGQFLFCFFMYCVYWLFCCCIYCFTVPLGQQLIVCGGPSSLTHCNATWVWNQTSLLLKCIHFSHVLKTWDHKELPAMSFPNQHALWPCYSDSQSSGANRPQPSITVGWISLPESELNITPDTSAEGGSAISAKEI